MDGFWLVSYLALWILVLTLAFASFAILRQVGLVYINSSEGTSRDGLAVGAHAPSLSMIDTSGNRQVLDFGSGKRQPTILIFGTAVCRPCIDLVPKLNRFIERSRDEFAVYFVCESSVDAARDFAQVTGTMCPVLVDADGKAAAKFKARVRPFAFGLDIDGVVRAKGVVNSGEHLSDLLKAAVRVGSEKTQSEHPITPLPGQLDGTGRVEVHHR